MTAIKTAEMARDDWLQERSKGIGGSDVATVLGLNPYKTPLSLWEEKTGKTKGSPAGEASGGKYRCITVLENDLAEECADCLVMISQLRLLIPGFSAKVDRVMHEKIERQINRISKEQQC